MKPVVLISLAALSLAACRQEPRPEPLPMPPSLSGPCDAAKVQDIIGKPRSEALARDARKRSGARMVRFLTPDMVVTLEYRGERLNIVLGTDGKVGSVNCG